MADNDVDNDQNLSEDDQEKMIQLAWNDNRVGPNTKNDEVAGGSPGLVTSKHTRDDSSLYETFTRRHQHLLYKGSGGDVGGILGAFQQAAEDGNNRILLLNIQDYYNDSGAFGSFTINRDIWANDTVQDLIKIHCVFFQTMRKSTDADYYTQHFCDDFNENDSKSYPYITMIDPVNSKILWSKSGWDVVKYDTSFTYLNFIDALGDAVQKLNGVKIGKPKRGSSRTLDVYQSMSSMSNLYKDMLPNELGIQRAVMTRMSSADCATAEEYNELQRALEESRKLTDVCVKRAKFERQASKRLGIQPAVLNRMTSTESMSEEEYRQLQQAIWESKQISS